MERYGYYQDHHLLFLNDYLHQKNKFYDSGIYQRLIWHCAVFFGTGKTKPKLLILKNQFRKLNSSHYRVQFSLVQSASRT